MARAARSPGAGRSGPPPAAPEPLPVPVVDTHCHLDLGAPAVAAAVAQAAAVGVHRLITIGVDVATSRWQAEVAAAHPQVWAGVAIHPNEVGAADGDALAAIAELAQLPQVRAVGETGLDHFRTGPGGHAAQEESFRAHIEIATAAGKALVIHDREAHEDVARVLASVGAPERTVFHCFSGDAAFARRCADAGWFCSFAGNVTFSSAAGLRAAAAVVPRELLLVETDAPFLTPTPHRGAPNGSYLVPWTVRALAEIRGEDLAELCAALTDNAERAFGPL